MAFAGSEPSTAETGETREIPLEFRGTGSEYFRIWIVNFFLTVLTLGLYSAWAKVRTERYFAGSTRLDGAAFAYLADPLVILRSRLLVIAVLGTYSIVTIFLPLLDVLFVPAFLLAIPWAIVRSLAFRAHNTSWRNVRFAFGAPYKEALISYVGLPLLGVASAGLLYPYAVFRQSRFVLQHAAFGTTRFASAARPEAFFRLFLRCFGGLIALGVAAVGVFAVSGEIGAALLGVITLPAYFYAFAYLSAGITNLTYDRATLGPHELRSNLPARGLAVLYAVNAIALLASLGLLVPWARIRVARYRLDHMQVIAAGSLDEFVAGQGEDVGSLGQEFGDALDLDIGL